MEETKKSKGLIWLIIILIIVILGLIGFIVYDKVLSTKNNLKPTKSSTTQKQELEKENNIVYNNITDMLKDFIQKELNEYDIKFNYDYMNDEVAKANIVISAMLNNNEIKKEWDININGDEATGSVRFEKQDFVNSYKVIIGSQPEFDKFINVTNITARQLEIKDNKITGNYVTGPSLYMIKPNKIICSNNECSLKLDYVYETDTNYDTLQSQYDNYEKNKNFDDNLINATINIDLTQNNNRTYKINHIIVTER